MNFYNPYFNSFPTMGSGIASTMGSAAAHSPGLISKLFGNLNLSSILSGTGKVVNFANQAIPLVKQMSPLVRNAKTMFKLMNEFKKVDEPKTTNIESMTTNSSNTTSDITTESYNQGGPIFFI